MTTTLLRYPRAFLPIATTLLTTFVAANVVAQVPADSLPSKESLDSLFIREVEDHREPDKVLHAEPLYIDLIRDLGARRGEREWNVGLGLTDNVRYDTYQALIEYEWAPVNRLGLEVEVPVTVYAGNGASGYGRPTSHVESLKTAFQWSFFVSERLKTTLAVGYINELKLRRNGEFRLAAPFYGNKYNPFFIAAKRWGDRWHTLLYTGPQWTQPVGRAVAGARFDVNTNLHYMIPGTRNFVGLEVNQVLTRQHLDTVLRPQLRVGIADNLLIGIVTGIPLQRDSERLGSFMRLIYEPAHKNRKPVVHP